MQVSKSLISLTFYSTLLLLTTTGAAYSHSARTQPVHLGVSPTLPLTGENTAPSIAHGEAEAGHAESETGHAESEAGHSMSGMDHASLSLGPDDEYFDLRFIDAMILHHQGAVQMAEEVLEKSDRLSLRNMAREIIRVQGREMRRMQSWRENWYPNADQQPLMYVAAKQQTLPMSEQMRDAMMMNMDMGPADDNFELRFINAMVPHHQGAVAMAGEALLRSDRLEIRRLSRSILGLQQQEIKQMRTWKEQWYDQ